MDNIFTQLANNNKFQYKIILILLLIVMVSFFVLAYTFGASACTGKYHHKYMEHHSSCADHNKLMDSETKYNEIKAPKNISYKYEDLEMDLSKPFHVDQPYPSLLSELYKNKANVKCTDLYFRGYKDNNYYSKSDEQLGLQKSIQLVNNLNRYFDGEDMVNTIRFCMAEGLNENNISSFFTYSIQDRCGGCGESTYVQPEFARFPVARIAHSYAFYSCDQLLFVDTENNAYFVCGGGDGPGVASAVTRVNLSEGLTEVLYECTSLETDTQCGVPN